MLSARDRLDQRMQLLGVEAKRSLGQNFLISDGVIAKILAAAQSAEAEGIIEIGPGLGALTDGLNETGRRLRLVEMDRTLAAYWRAQGLDICEGDALLQDWEKLTESAKSWVLVSNLPYQISSSILIDRSLGPDSIGEMILMFQKEVAQRIRARPSTEDYGMLSVIAQIFWQVDLISEAGPRDFQPAPKVASRVLRFRRLPKPVIKDREAFLSFVKSAFAQRRKLLKSNLMTAGFAGLEIDKQLADLQLKAQARAEELTPLKLAELFLALRK